MDFPCTQQLPSDVDNPFDSSSSETKQQVAVLLVLKHQRYNIEGTEHAIYTGENIIGRDIGDIAIPNGLALSQKHACIEVEGDTAFLFDYGSRNGTKLGTIKLKPNVRYSLQNNIRITFANIQCVYKKLASRTQGNVETPKVSTFSNILAPDTPEYLQRNIVLSDNILNVIPESPACDETILSNNSSTSKQNLTLNELNNPESLLQPKKLEIVSDSDATDLEDDPEVSDNEDEVDVSPSLPKKPPLPKQQFSQLTAELSEAEDTENSLLLFSQTSYNTNAAENISTKEQVVQEPQNLPLAVTNRSKVLTEDHSQITNLQNPATVNINKTLQNIPEKNDIQPTQTSKTPLEREVCFEGEEDSDVSATCEISDEEALVMSIESNAVNSNPKKECSINQTESPLIDKNKNKLKPTEEPTRSGTKILDQEKTNENTLNKQTFKTDQVKYKIEKNNLDQPTVSSIQEPTSSCLEQIVKVEGTEGTHHKSDDHQEITNINPADIMDMSHNDKTEEELAYENCSIFVDSDCESENQNKHVMEISVETVNDEKEKLSHKEKLKSEILAEDTLSSQPCISDENKSNVKIEFVPESLENETKNSSYVVSSMEESKDSVKISEVKPDSDKTEFSNQPTDEKTISSNDVKDEFQSENKPKLSETSTTKDSIKKEVTVASTELDSTTNLSLNKLNKSKNLSPKVESGNVTKTNLLDSGPDFSLTKREKILKNLPILEDSVPVWGLSSSDSEYEDYLKIDDEASLLITDYELGATQPYCDEPVVTSTPAKPGSKKKITKSKRKSKKQTSIQSFALSTPATSSSRPSRKGRGQNSKYADFEKDLTSDQPSVAEPNTEKGEQKSSFDLVNVDLNSNEIAYKKKDENSNKISTEEIVPLTENIVKENIINEIVEQVKPSQENQIVPNEDTNKDQLTASVKSSTALQKSSHLSITKIEPNNIIEADSLEEPVTKESNIVESSFPKSDDENLVNKNNKVVKELDKTQDCHSISETVENKDNTLEKNKHTSNKITSEDTTTMFTENDENIFGNKTTSTLFDSSEEEADVFLGFDEKKIKNKTKCSSSSNINVDKPDNIVERNQLQNENDVQLEESSASNQIALNIEESPKTRTKKSPLKKSKRKTTTPRVMATRNRTSLNASSIFLLKSQSPINEKKRKTPDIANKATEKSNKTINKSKKTADKLKKATATSNTTSQQTIKVTRKSNKALDNSKKKDDHQPSPLKETRQKLNLRSKVSETKVVRKKRKLFDGELEVLQSEQMSPRDIRRSRRAGQSTLKDMKTKTKFTKAKQQLKEIKKELLTPQKQKEIENSFTETTGISIKEVKVEVVDIETQPTSPKRTSKRNSVNSSTKLASVNKSKTSVRKTRKRKVSSKDKGTPKKKIKNEEDEDLAALYFFRERKLKPKIMFTGFLDQEAEKTVVKLGGEMTKDLQECTHLISKDICRRLKFFCALVRGAHILTPDWINQSKLAKRFLEVEQFQLSENWSLFATTRSPGKPWTSPHLTSQVEKQYNFSLRESLTNARLRTQPLFYGLSIHVTTSVQPSPGQLYDIITCGGGIPVRKLPAGKKSIWPKDLIVVSCLKDKKACANAIKAGVCIVNNEFILTGVLQQKLLYDCTIFT